MERCAGSGSCTEAAGPGAEAAARRGEEEQQQQQPHGAAAASSPGPGTR